jgi:hypothetical protein
VVTCSSTKGWPQGWRLSRPEAVRSREEAGLMVGVMGVVRGGPQRDSVATQSPPDLRTMGGYGLRSGLGVSLVV